MAVYFRNGWQVSPEYAADLRESLADEQGIKIPKVHIIDNMKLPSYGFAVFLGGKRVDMGTVDSDDPLSILVERLGTSIAANKSKIS